MRTQTIVPLDLTVPLVRQRRRTDCGIAVVAMVTSVPYGRVKQFLFGSRRQRHYMTYGRDISRALRHFGVRHERWRKTSNPASIAEPAVVFLCEDSSEIGHWVFLYQRRNGEVLSRSV
jgi:hypothetical protein